MANFSYGTVDTLVGTAVGVETNVAALIVSLGSQPSAADLLNVQTKMQQWSLLVDLAATMAKTLSETLKSIVQKAG